MSFTDALSDIWQDVVQSPHVISSAFDSIKNIFNEILLFVYYIYFFIVFLLFVTIAIGIFIAMPVYLVKKGLEYRQTIAKIMHFDFSDFLN